MDSNPTMPLQTHLPRPARGGSTRVQFGNKEVVLESTRGGYSLLWLDGREARRLAIGLAADGTLRLALRAPRLPVRVAVRDTVTLAPRSRLRGYVQVPLVPTILWHDDNSEPQLLAEFPRADLAAEWDDREGTFYRCVSPLHVRYPIPGAEPRATVLCAVLLDLLNDRSEPEFAALSRELTRLDRVLPRGEGVEQRASQIAEMIRGEMGR